MDDTQIIKMLFERNEKAITELEEKYGKVCSKIAFNIVGNDMDADECENDTYLAVWNQIPPDCPENLYAYVCRITRNLSLKRLRFNLAAKRSPLSVIPISEIEDFLPDETQTEAENIRIGEILNDFLRNEREDSRNVFIRKYWFFDSISDISLRYSFSESKVKSMLFHARKRLAEKLKKEGIMF